jgi:UDP-N-acetylglucosamine 2-epimerase (hydrolysing)
MKKIALIIGTRPEAIKMAPVYLALRESFAFETSLIVTAQHRELLDQVLTVFGIESDLDLDIMEPGQSLPDLSARIISRMQGAFEAIRPDAVLVHGDTTTCLFSAIAAFYEKVPVGHVEAGLRTFDLEAPWPEEMNRRLTDPISKWCFAPTPKAADNLRAEGISDERVYVTGNTIVDALHLALQMIGDKAESIPGLDQALWAGKRLILVTGHRRENLGKRMAEVFLALRDIVERFSDTVVVYPVHLNPKVQHAASDILSGHDRIYLIDPVNYLSFIRLMDKSAMIITDSGGIQEEATVLKRPVLITRGTTERPEVLEEGYVKLAGMSRDVIVREASSILQKEVSYPLGDGSSPMGDGRASMRIMSILDSSLCSG